MLAVCVGHGVSFVDQGPCGCLGSIELAPGQRRRILAVMLGLLGVSLWRAAKDPGRNLGDASVGAAEDVTGGRT